MGKSIATFLTVGLGLMGCSKMMEEVLVMLGFVILYYALTAIPIAFVIRFLGRRRAQWLWRELVLLVVPLVAWLAWSGFGYSMPGKSLSNLVAEPFFCGILAGLSLLPRAILPVPPSVLGKLRLSLVGSLVAVLGVILIIRIVPSLPE